MGWGTSLTESHIDLLHQGGPVSSHGKGQMASGRCRDRAGKAEKPALKALPAIQVTQSHVQVAAGRRSVTGPAPPGGAPAGCPRPSAAPRV
eukprot:764056-Hanusia_phi.AAC.6